ncbi:hypothetical protein D1817_00010 [Flavobacteriaceae bacterium]|nr:hypothetical protein D1817_00010 [Flavobacteriaceae bacterium]
MFTKKNTSLSIKWLILLFVTTYYGYSQNITQDFGPTDLVVNNTLSTTTSSALTGTTDVNTYSYIRLGVNENIEPFTAYRFKLTLQVTPTLPDGTLDSNSSTVDIEVNHNLSPGIGNVIDLSQHIVNDSYGLSITILGTEFEDIGNGSATEINGAVPENITLTVGFETNRYYELPQLAPTNLTGVLANNNTELEVAWDEVPEARYYELEWTWVDNYGEQKDVALTPSDVFFSAKYFGINSTRVQTSDLDYKIPLVYSRGFIIYRVRAVGNFLADLSKNKYSSWTSSPQGDEATVADWNHIYEITADHEANKNWQFQASYAEDGKKKEVVSYFDGSLRNRQTVTTINSDENAVIGEVVYDAQGRPAVEVLPVPTNENQLKYYTGFNTNNAGEHYRYTDFDLDLQNITDQPSDAKKMGVTSGASNYYSSSNTLADNYQNRIPDALQYPFSQIEYTPDNTGRIRRKSGVGNIHQLGSGHEMEYYYAVPEQKELNRLFGYAVGNASHYKKNMVLDPNGQLSISYIDPQGRTIATALAGDTPEHLIGLDDETNTALHDDLTTDLLGKITNTDTDTPIDNNEAGITGAYGPLEDKLSYSAIKTVVFDGTRTFNYDVTNNVPFFIYECVVDNSYPVIYDLTIDVLDEDAQSILPKIEQTVNLGDTSEAPGNTFSIPETIANVDRGTFTVSKTLTVNDSVVEAYADNYIARLQDENDPCYVAPTTITPEPIIIDDCDVSCEECEANFTALYATPSDYANSQIATYDQNVIASLDQEELDRLTEALETQWQDAIDACRAPCLVDNLGNGETPNTTSCEIALNQLLLDMSPTGQYGNGINGGETGLLNIFDANNVLFSTKTSDGTHNSWKNPYHADYDGANSSTSLFTSGHYYDDDGTVSYLKVRQVEIEVDGETQVSYIPAIDINGVNSLTPTEDVETSKEYFVEPQYLLNSSNFIEIWQSSWAYSLLSYHPEYDYLLYTNALCELEHTTTTNLIFTSDGFDGYLQGITTYDEAANVGLLTTNTTAILDQDPYFQNQLSGTFESSTIFSARQSIMNEALTTNYDGSNKSMLSTIYSTVACNSLSECNPPTETNTIITELNTLEISRQDQFWNSYKASYLALKQRIKSVFINAYAQTQVSYNGCIGISEAPAPLVANISTYTSAASTLTAYLNGLPEGLCNDTYVDNYITKQKRFLPTDMLHNAGADPEDVVDDIADQVDYEYYINTGTCPLARDMTLYLDGYFKESSLSGNSVSGTRLYNGQYLGKNLFEEFGGIFPANTVSTNASISGEELTLNITSDALLPDSDVTVNIPTTFTALNFNWSNYGSSWDIVNVLNMTASYDETTQVFSYQALAQIDASGTYHEIIITGTTLARISNCSISDPTGDGQYLGGGNTYDETGACNKESQFSKAMVKLIDELSDTNQINAANVNVSSLNIYDRGYLPDFFGNGVAIWSFLGDNTYVIDIDGEQRFLMSLDQQIPTGVTVTDLSFDLIYNTAEDMIVGQSAKVTWLDGNFNRASAEGTATATENALLNFLCCDDINDYYVFNEEEANCAAHIGFAFSIPNSLPMNNDRRLNLGEGVTRFANTTIDNAISFTTIDDHSTGTRFISNETDHAVLIDPTTVNTSNEIISLPLFRAQDTNYSNTILNLTNGILNASFNAPMDVLYYLITADRVGDIGEIRTAMNDLYAENVVNKIFFIVLDGTDTTITRTDAALPALTPYEFLDELLDTRTPIEFTPSLGVRFSDYIAFDATEFDGANFETTIEQFLIDGYNDICSEEALQTGIEQSSIITLSTNSVIEQLNQTQLSIPAPIGIGQQSSTQTFASQQSFNTALEDITAILGETRLKPAFTLRKQVSGGGPTGDGSQGNQLYFRDVFFSPIGLSIGLDELVNLELNIDFDTYSTNEADYNSVEMIINGQRYTPANNNLNIQFNEGTTLDGSTTHFPPANRLSWNAFFPMDFDVFNFSYDINTIKRSFPLNEGSGSALSSDGISQINPNPSSWIDDPLVGTGLAFNTTLEGTWADDTPFIFEQGVSLGFKAQLKLKNELPVDNFGFIAQIDYQDPDTGDLYQLLIFGVDGDPVAESCSAIAECIPQPVDPVSCTEKFDVFNATIATLNDTEQAYTLEEFCELQLAYITDDYEYYLTQLGVADPALSERYITITTFGATEFGYGYNDMQSVIDAYVTHVNDVTLTSDEIKTWAQFTSDHLNEISQEGAICISLPVTLPITTDDYTIDLPEDSPCKEFETSIYTSYSLDAYGTFLEREREDFIKAYLKNATENAVENFTMTYFDKEYQYTLYYYDQAGNLTQTVPPQGVDRFTDAELNAPVAGGSLSLNDRINMYRNTNEAAEVSTLLPDHEYKTEYNYNSLNQLVQQYTPDGGETRFAYDALGRIVASQNAKQLANNNFSYTTYDELGRIVEAGELVPNTAIAINTTTGKLVNTTTGLVVNTNGFTDDGSTPFPQSISSNQQEVTRTRYTDPVTNAVSIFETVQSLDDLTLTNSRNRVTAVYYYNNVTTSTNQIDFDNAMYYNYDIHGNVNEFVQHHRVSFVDPIDEDFTTSLYDGIKRIQYEYDLISGNVNKVYYQKGKIDQFIHKYNYDADNRIVQVETSSDGVIWETDSSYDYYAHGPMARMELGDKKVQGMDYAYTIQGWLKGVNSDQIGEANDLGGDGAVNGNVAQDAYGYALTYNDEDYQPIGSINAFVNSSTGPQNIKNLYNGNIKQMATALTDHNETVLGTQLNHYEYDQLNRIKSMNGYDISEGANTNNYSGNYSYDRNGNLNDLSRQALTNSTLQTIDNLTYSYKTKLNPQTGLQEKTNQLDHVDETISQALYNDLIDQNNGNYTYDEIGQLISDDREALNITWRVDGKVDNIVKAGNFGFNNTTIQFHYDGLGNRIAKTVSDEDSFNATTTVYVRDAQGNVMAVYNTTADIFGLGGQPSVTLKEHHIYGSSRLGIEQKNISIPSSGDGAPAVANNIYNRTVGDKRFELSNHLGNVLEVVSDRKIMDNGSSDAPGVVVFTSDFETTINPWSEYGSGFSSLNRSGGRLSVRPFIGPVGGIGDYALTAGRTYTVTLDVDRSTFNTSLEFRISGSGVNLNQAIATSGTFTHTFTANQTGDYNVIVSTPSSGFLFSSGTYYVDNVIIEDVTDAQSGGSGSEENLAIFMPDVLSFNDYYPFGMLLPNRHGSTDNYRYGFNGKEKDDEIKGEGLQYDYGFRIYDARLGKFLSIDPLSSTFPWYTPYQFAGNKPILAIDLDGLEEYIPIPDTNESSTPKLKTSNEPTIPCVECHHNVVLDWSLLSEEDLRQAENVKIGGLIVLTIITGGIAYEAYASGELAYGFYKLAAIASNPINQQTAVGVAGLTASLIDPDPLNDYPGNFDDVARPLKYLFRGTTKGFQGGATAIKHSATFTSTDPLKATIFSELNKAKGKAILLLGDIKALKDIPILPSNRLAEMEKEVVLNIKPSLFFERTASITLSQAKAIFKEMGIEVPSGVSMQNINTILKETKELTQGQINTFYKKATDIAQKEELKR